MQKGNREPRKLSCISFNFFLLPTKTTEPNSNHKPNRQNPKRTTKEQNQLLHSFNFFPARTEPPRPHFNAHQCNKKVTKTKVSIFHSIPQNKNKLKLERSFLSIPLIRFNPPPLLPRSQEHLLLPLRNRDLSSNRPSPCEGVPIQTDPSQPHSPKPKKKGGRLVDPFLGFSFGATGFLNLPQDPPSWHPL